MNALAKALSSNLYFFPTTTNNYNIPLVKMDSPIRPSDWIYCLNNFQQYSPLQDYVFATDRAFTLKSCMDAIVNHLHCHEDIALNIVAPELGLPVAEVPTSLHCLKDAMQGNTAQSRKYLDNLLAETRLLSQLVPKSRVVNYLHVNNTISNLFSPAELTELMFNLSRQFSLRHDGTGRYVIELYPSQCSDSKIALYKGLGFNHICIDLTQNDSQQVPAEQVTEDILLMREYEFESVHTRVHLVGTQKSAYQAYLSNLIKAGPDSICIFDEHADQAPLPLTTLPPLTWEHDCLIEGGYTQVSCRRYVRQDYEDIWHIHDLLSVGLGGTSFIDNMFTHSADHIGPYYESLAAGKLPFCSGGYIHKRKKRAIET
jgi:hypothetical protein